MMRAVLPQPFPSNFPSPRAGDDEDLRRALSTGEALWLRGEHADALRWLRRAADRASELDDDTRAAELLRALDACFHVRPHSSAEPEGERPTLPPGPASSAAPAPSSAPRPSRTLRPPWAAPSDPGHLEEVEEVEAEIVELDEDELEEVDELDDLLDFSALEKPSSAGASASRPAAPAARPSPSDPLRHAIRVAVTRVAGRTEIAALEPGEPAPRGSVAAFLIAVDGDDAAVLRTLLGR